MYWLGLDVGTSGSRALLVDAGGRVRYSFTAAHEEMQMPRPLWAEQHPDDWWRASQIAIKGLLQAAGVDGSSVSGIGLSGQMHGLVLLDEAQEVIRPALIWCDQRSQRQVDFINSTVQPEKVLRSIANPMLTGFTLPKLLWVRDNEPQKFASVRKMLLPKDYVRFRLTGEFATEVSDASGTGLFDVVNRKWSTEMTSALGLDAAILPKAYESSQVTGKISAHAAKTTGARARYAGRRRRGRSGSECDWKRHRGAGYGFLHYRHVGRRVRLFGKAGVRSGRPRSYLLPRHSRRLECHGCDARRRIELSVVSKPLSAGYRVRRFNRRSYTLARRRPWTVLASLSDG